MSGAVGLVLLFGASRSLAAQDMPVPVERQFPVFVKVFAFDRQLRHRVGEEIVIGVLYQRRVRESVNAKEAVAEAANGGMQVDGLPVRFVDLEMDEGEVGLRQRILTHGIDVLYVAPLRAQSVEDIVALSRELQLLTCTGVPEYVQKGISVGIGVQSSRPVILINLRASRAEGARFSSELLKLVRLVDET